jgi:hypothetical protein
MRLNAGAPPELWPLALSAFTHVRNLLPIHGTKSPSELWSGFCAAVHERLAHVLVGVV